MGQKSITDLPGVYGGAIRCGIKEAAAPDKKDLTYLFVPGATAAAGVFTLNKFRAPCLDFTKLCLESAAVQAVVVNSGNANAATGKQGFANAERTATIAAELLGLEPRQVAVASTGIIGVQLPMPKIESGLRSLLKNPKQLDGAAVADAIMTTDTFPKSAFLAKDIDGQSITVAGIAKGAGMIAPNMGTMLGFLVTDAAIAKADLQTSLLEATEKSFNMVTVDSDTSTNDMVLILSTGKRQVERSKFQTLLNSACIDLAKQIARDGEGATKLIEVEIHGASSEEDAKNIALSISNSPLVKTAVHGADPNWGRIVMAIGKTPNVQVDPARVDVYLGEIHVFSQGAPLTFDRSQAAGALKGKEVLITVDLNLGPHRATAWGCDLTKGYIDINTDYS